MWSVGENDTANAPVSVQSKIGIEACGKIMRGKEEGMRRCGKVEKGAGSLSHSADSRWKKEEVVVHRSRWKSRVGALKGPGHFIKHSPYTRLVPEDIARQRRPLSANALG